MLKAVVFDIGDTLLRLDPLPEDLAERMAMEMAATAGVADDVAAKVVRTAMQSARTRAGDGTHREPNITIELSEAARRFGMPLAPEIATAVADCIGRADVARFVPNARVAVVFGELKATGLRIGLLSNTWTRGSILRQYFDAEGAGEHLSFGVYSGDEGIRKPHRDIYQRALDGLNVEAHEALFVGDRVVEDVLGPMALGMRAVLTHEHRGEDPGAANPFAIIKRLEEIVEIAAALSTASGG